MPIALKPRTFSLLLSQHQAKAAMNPINQICDWNCTGKPTLVRFPKQSLVSFFRSQRPKEEDHCLNGLITRGKKGPHKTNKKRPRRRMDEENAKEKWQQLRKVFDAMDNFLPAKANVILLFSTHDLLELSMEIKHCSKLKHPMVEGCSDQQHGKRSCYQFCC